MTTTPSPLTKSLCFNSRLDGAGIMSVPIADVLSAVALLKEKITNEPKYPDRKRVIELIDECFQIEVNDK